MNVSKPHTAVSPTLNGDVLVVLAGTTGPLTGRQTARLAGRKSHRGVQLALDRLVEQGLVHAQDAGAATLYTLNREHLGAPAVEVLASMRTELLHRLRDALNAWRITPVHASLFGSTARRDGDTTSDIDLFMVRPHGTDEEDPLWRKQINDLADNVRAWTGNHAGIVEMSAEEVPSLRNSKRPVVKELRGDGVDLVGKPLSQLLRRSA